MCRAESPREGCPEGARCSSGLADATYSYPANTLLWISIIVSPSVPSFRPGKLPEKRGPPFVYLSRRRGLLRRLGFLRRAHRRLLRNRRCVPFRKDDRRLSRKFTLSRVVSACAVSQNAHFLQFSREKEAREMEREGERGNDTNDTCRTRGRLQRGASRVRV